MKIIWALISLCFTLPSLAQNQDALFATANKFFDAENYAAAYKQVNLAMKTDPENVKYMMFKGLTQEKLKMYQAAFDTYTSIIEKFPDNSHALLNRGNLFYSSQDFESALSDFNKGMSLAKADSERISFHLNLGAVKSSTRNYQGAYDNYMSAYALDSMNIGILNNLATVCDEVGKGELTLGYLEKIIRIDPTFVGAYGNIGFKYQEMGNYARAITYFDKVLEMNKNEPLGYSNRAFNKYKLGDLKGALSDINKSIDLYPSNSYALRIRALIYLAQKKNTEACKDLDKAHILGFTEMYGDEVDKLISEFCK